MAHRWYDIGLALGFKSSALDSIKSKGHDVHELLRTMITEWLKMSYNVEMFGPPTWRRIVEAVRANSGGKNPALADTLARKYKGEHGKMAAVASAACVLSTKRTTFV